MSERYILAIDQGTTGTTILLCDRRGAVVGRAYRELTQHFPQPGWVEHDALEIARGVEEAIAECVASVDPKAIAGIGITNQRETVVMWDRKTGNPVHRAIVWQDRRTATECDRLRAEGLDEWFAAKTGLIIDPYFSGTKVKWLLDNLPGLRERAIAGEIAFGTVDSWLLYRLTGGAVHGTDASNASRTMLFNITDRQWDEAILERFDIPAAVLPEVLPNSGVVGHTVAGVLPEGIPIAGMAGDQQAALFGQGCLREGDAKNTYGTGCFLLVNTGDRPVFSQNRLLTTIAWEIDGKTTYALEGSIFMAGATVQWLRDGLGIIGSAAETEPLARSVEDNGGVYLVPAFVGLGSPYWDAYARGTIVGLTRGSTRAHIARAALEAIAYQTRDLMACMEADTGRTLSELRVDGGATANTFLMQFQSDVLGLPVRRGGNPESTAWGAAKLAGLGVGFWTVDDLPEGGEPTVWAPEMAKSTRDALHYQWRRAVDRALGWVEAERSATPSIK